MSEVERVQRRLEVPLDSDELAKLGSAGWRVVAVELERERPVGEELGAKEEVPFGLRVAQGADRLEEDPDESSALATMMELLIQEGPYYRVADELNRRGFRTRKGSKWSPVSVFQMLPRLIEVWPRLFSSEGWHQRRDKTPRMMG